METANRDHKKVNEGCTVQGAYNQREEHKYFIVSIIVLKYSFGRHKLFTPNGCSARLGHTYTYTKCDPEKQSQPINIVRELILLTIVNP